MGWSEDRLNGLFTTASMCDQFHQSLDAAQAAANKLQDEYGDKSTQYQDAQRAIDAYGKENIDNGVTVQIGTTLGCK